MSVSVIQLGARMHYAIPVILNNYGILDKFYTDLYIKSKFLHLFRFLPDWKLTRKLISRNHYLIPDLKIINFNLFGIIYTLKLHLAKSENERLEIFNWAGKKINSKVINSKPVESKIFYTFNTAAKELIDFANQKNIKTVVEQTILPKILEKKIMDDEYVIHPYLVKREDNLSSESLNEYIEREIYEWKNCSMIICASEFVKDGLKQLGIPDSKIKVIPYGYSDNKIKNVLLSKERNKKLKVLTVGQVGLRKGSHYIFEAAQKLNNDFEFRMIGKIDFDAEYIKKFNDIIDFRGVVPRNDISKHYEWADVFLLPSLCEGSATVIYEALSFGLPIICTENTGSIISDRKEGFIIPIRSVDAIIDKLLIFKANPDLLESFSRNAIIKSEEYTIEKYGEKLFKIISELMDN